MTKMMSLEILITMAQNQRAILFITSQMLSLNLIRFLKFTFELPTIKPASYDHHVCPLSYPPSSQHLPCMSFELPTIKPASTMYI